MQNNRSDTATVSRREITGVVKSDKMDKTIVVHVMRLAKHPKYQKVIKKYTNYKAHDPKNEAKTGDKVRIMETRPISKDKRWRLIEILK